MTAAFGIVVHGGAGAIDAARLGADGERAHREILAAALDAGHAVLAGGGRALDAVQAAVVVLEDAAEFNAGRGSVLTHDGQIEMDASLMDGATGEAGAVAAVSGVRNPILAARTVLDRSPHVLLVGAGAVEFARQEGLAFEPPEYFLTPERVAEHARARDEAPRLDHDRKMGTVGAVALDRGGHVAAATSTGGMTNKRFGRAGDSPIVGAGTWARDATAAVSCTGHGEYFIREAAAHTVSARIEYGGDLEHAAAATIAAVGALGGRGGLIAIDRAGRVATPYNTAGMYRGWRLEGGRAEIRIWAR